MTSAKRLETFEVVDKFGSEEQALIEHALAGVHELAAAYGWQEVSVKRSEKAPVREGDRLHHFFDIYGVQTASVDVGSDQDKAVSSEAPIGDLPRSKL